MTRTAYPSDLTDNEWAILEPLIPLAKPRGRPRSVNMREILNGIFYILRGGVRLAHVAGATTPDVASSSRAGRTATCLSGKPNTRLYRVFNRKRHYLSHFFATRPFEPVYTNASVIQAPFESLSQMRVVP